MPSAGTERRPAPRARLLRPKQTTSHKHATFKVPATGPFHDTLILSTNYASSNFFLRIRLHFSWIYSADGKARAGAGRAAGRVARPLAFSTPISRSVGRSASQSTTLVFFVYFLFYSFNLLLGPHGVINIKCVVVGEWIVCAEVIEEILFWQSHVGIELLPVPEFWSVYNTYNGLHKPQVEPANHQKSAIVLIYWM